MFRSPVRSSATVAVLAVSLVLAGTTDIFAQRGGGGGAGARTSGSGGGRGGAVPAGSVRTGGPVGPSGRTGVAVPRGVVGRPNGQAVVVGGSRYGYGYCCGYYGYPYGYYNPWYGWGAGIGWGWGAGWGFSVGFSWGYPYPAYYGGYRYAYGYPYPYSPYYYGRYAPAPPPPPAAGYLDATTDERRTPIPDQIQQPSASFGMISMRVQPVDAEVVVDGETWTSPENSRLVIQLAPGRHRVSVRKAGFDTYSEEILIRVGATMTLNVSLLRGQK